MRYFADTGILFLFGLFGAFYVPVDISFVLAVLCGMIFLCAQYVFQNRPARLAFCLFYGAAAFFLPDFALFYPVLTYALNRCHFYPLTLLFTGIFVYLTQRISALPLVCTLSGCAAILLSLFLAYSTEKYSILEENFRRTSDDTREHNLLLAEKNRMLLANQDYEIYTATLKERNRIAREIHDNVGHVLSRSILLVGAARTLCQDSSLAPILESLDVSLNSAMDSIRTSVHDLHDEAVNLEETVRELVSEFTFCSVNLVYDMSRELPRDVKYCFIAITKEALENVRKHSNASQINLTFREHPAMYQMRVEDNGSTLHKDIKNSGIGLKNMQERVKMLGGNLQLDTTGGFHIFIMIPKK